MTSIRPILQWLWFLAVLAIGLIAWSVFIRNLLQLSALESSQPTSFSTITDLIFVLGCITLAFFTWSERKTRGLRAYGGALFYVAAALYYFIGIFGTTFWVSRLLEFLIATAITLYTIGYGFYLRDIQPGLRQEIF